jgi:putative iron-regulated protein
MHRTTRPLRRHLALAVVACTALVGAGCSGDEDANGDTTTTVEDVTGSLTAEQATPVAEHYADGVYASYQASVASATELQASVQAFTDDPTEANLTAAKDQWLAARDDYGPTGRSALTARSTTPMTARGRINAWPMDEATSIRRG